MALFLPHHHLTVGGGICSGSTESLVGTTSRTLNPLEVSVGNVSPLSAFSDDCRTPSLHKAVGFIPDHLDPNTGRLSMKRSLQSVLRDSENKIGKKGTSEYIICKCNSSINLTPRCIFANA